MYMEFWKSSFHVVDFWLGELLLSGTIFTSKLDKTSR